LNESPLNYSTRHGLESLREKNVIVCLCIFSLKSIAELREDSNPQPPTRPQGKHPDAWPKFTWYIKSNYKYEKKYVS